MAPVSNKRSMMTYYSDPTDCYCHQVRIVLAEKDVSYEISDVDQANLPEELKEMNPYGTVPVLVDRELVLYESKIIMEYLDERFPHPPLLPVYPVARAKFRLMMHRVQKDWFSQVNIIETAAPAAPTAVEEAKKKLKEGILAAAPIFDELPFFFSDTFSLVDCCLAPLFWRLPSYGIEIPSHAKQIMAYQERLFKRNSFKKSLSEQEKAMREAA